MIQVFNLALIATIPLFTVFLAANKKTFTSIIFTLYIPSEWKFEK